MLSAILVQLFYFHGYNTTHQFGLIQYFPMQYSYTGSHFPILSSIDKYSHYGMETVSSYSGFVSALNIRKEFHGVIRKSSKNVQEVIYIE